MRQPPPSPHMGNNRCFPGASLRRPRRCVRRAAEEDENENSTMGFTAEDLTWKWIAVGDEVMPHPASMFFLIYIILYFASFKLVSVTLFDKRVHDNSGFGCFLCVQNIYKILARKRLRAYLFSFFKGIFRRNTVTGAS